MALIDTSRALPTAFDDTFTAVKESATWRKEKVLQIGAFGLLANEVHASIPTAPRPEAPKGDLLDPVHALTVCKRLAARNLALTTRFPTRMRIPCWCGRRCRAARA
jgi:hypothetical protein